MLREEASLLFWSAAEAQILQGPGLTNNNNNNNHHHQKKTQTKKTLERTFNSSEVPNNLEWSL